MAESTQEEDAMTETEPRPRGDKENIPEELHRRASAMARKLMNMPEEPDSTKRADEKGTTPARR